ncbi:hypothetical protein OWV82_016112 [Melia azedarach]|uniref:Uncharacterized protein n=1 Tax=Melia azedarach TaxID=155640 RepID=A0ACC1XG79_MELAZ|nr:hypothetical protein OWV82_016112 [Melia azedarach]
MGELENERKFSLKKENVILFPTPPIPMISFSSFLSLLSLYMTLDFAAPNTSLAIWSEGYSLLAVSQKTINPPPTRFTYNFSYLASLVYLLYFFKFVITEKKERKIELRKLWDMGECLNQLRLSLWLVLTKEDDDEEETQRRRRGRLKWGKIFGSGRLGKKKIFL